MVLQGTCRDNVRVSGGCVVDVLTEIGLRMKVMVAVVVSSVLVTDSEVGALGNHPEDFERCWHHG